MQETQVRSLGWEDPLEKRMATHSSIHAGKSHGQRSLAGYSAWGRQEPDTTERLISSNNGTGAPGPVCVAIFLWAFAWLPAIPCFL